MQSQSFRQEISDLHHRIQLGADTPVPDMLASATVPPIMESQVLTAHGVPPHRFVLIHEPTVRFNIAYSVIYVAAKRRKRSNGPNSSPMMEALQRVIRNAHDQWQSCSPQGLRVIVYCPFKNLCARAVSMLADDERSWSITSYTASLETDERDAVYRTWICASKTTRIVVATCCFGTGIDVQDV